MTNPMPHNTLYLFMLHLFRHIQTFYFIFCWVDNNLNFCASWSCCENPIKSLRAAEKSQGAAEKNKEKVEANCTGFSAVLWFSVS